MKKLQCVWIIATLVLLSHAAKAGRQDTPTPPFTDLDHEHWAYQAVIDMEQRGILLGYPDKTFRGTKPVTRNELAYVIRRTERCMWNVQPDTEKLEKDIAALKQEVALLKKQIDALTK